jgi:hypothetical protein
MAPYRTHKKYSKWSKDLTLIKDAKFAAAKAGVRPKDLEYVGLQTFEPYSTDAMHLWNVMNPKSPKYQSTIAGRIGAIRTF